MSKIFIDTNILVYSMDDFDLEKKEKSRFLLKSLTKKHYGVISTQVMQEFYVAVTRKLCVDPVMAKNILHSFERFEIITVTPNLINDAIDCSIINQLSFWDSLILVSAESANCKEVWTEDLNDGQIIRGVKIENPLK
ncbi:MAG: PIN domain-containing protein [Proteobacteria bacterium]|nr:PIN domain-containing protein [Pseudomonadota bacterium]